MTKRNSHCFVSKCKSGYSSCQEKVSLFSVPRDEERRKLWKEAIPRYDRELSIKDAICEKHFEQDQIIRGWTSGHLYFPYMVPRLSKTAIPTIFSISSDSTKKYLSKRKYNVNNKHKNKKFKTSQISNINTILTRTTKLKIYNKNCKISDKSKETKIDNNNDCIEKTNSCDKIEEIETNDCSKNNENAIDSDEENYETEFIDDPDILNLPCFLKSVNNNIKKGNEIEKDDVFSEENKNNEDVGYVVVPNIFKQICDKIVILKLPNPSWAIHIIKNKYISITELDCTDLRPPSPKRQILLHYNFILQFFAATTELTNIHEYLDTKNALDSVSNLEKLIENFQNLNLCSGGPFLREYPESAIYTTVGRIDNDRWRHKQCPILFNNNNMPYCKYCNQLFNTFNKQIGRGKFLSRDPVQSLLRLRILYHNNQKTLSRCQTRIAKLKTKLLMANNELEKLKKNKVSTELDRLNMPAAQKLLINECIKNASHKSSTCRRYTEEWLLYCLLLYHKSTTVYEFISANNILPLCTIGTIKRSMQRLKINCNIDKDIITAFVANVSDKINIQDQAKMLLDYCNSVITNQDCIFNNEDSNDSEDRNFDHENEELIYKNEDLNYETEEIVCDNEENLSNDEDLKSTETIVESNETELDSEILSSVYVDNFEFVNQNIDTSRSETSTEEDLQFLENTDIDNGSEEIDYGNDGIIYKVEEIDDLKTFLSA